MTPSCFEWRWHYRPNGVGHESCHVRAFILAERVDIASRLLLPYSDVMQRSFVSSFDTPQCISQPPSLQKYVDSDSGEIADYRMEQENFPTVVVLVQRGGWAVQSEHHWSTYLVLCERVIVCSCLAEVSNGNQRK